MHVCLILTGSDVRITTGVPHMGELPHVWGWPLLRYNPEVRASSKIVFDIIEWTCDEDMKWVYFIQEMWANFAKYG